MTYRRLQRFFQFVDLGADWAAPVVAGLLQFAGPLTLVLDRTNWKVGRREINLLVLAVATRRHRVGLMWTVLDRAGNSGAKERIALIERFCGNIGPALPLGGLGGAPELLENCGVRGEQRGAERVGLGRVELRYLELSQCSLGMPEVEPRARHRDGELNLNGHRQ